MLMDDPSYDPMYRPVVMSESDAIEVKIWPTARGRDFEALRYQYYIRNVLAWEVVLSTAPNSGQKGVTVVSRRLALQWCDIEDPRARNDGLPHGCYRHGRTALGSYWDWTIRSSPGLGGSCECGHHGRNDR
jgi:hypothetical protein